MGTEGGRPAQTLRRAYGQAALAVVLVAFALRGFVIQGYRIPSSSMLPTLLAGDYVLVNKLQYGLRVPGTGGWMVRYRSPEPGDVIVFTGPARGPGGVPDQSDFVKRVVVVSGQSVTHLGGRLESRGGLVPSGRGGTGPGSPGRSSVGDEFGPLRVPPDELFVVGDNLEDSQDSRDWGFLERDRVFGKVMLVFWSWDSTERAVRWERIGRLVR